MKEKLKELFEYNHDINESLIGKFLENKNSLPDKVQDLLNHILNAQQIWNARIVRKNPFETWQINEDHELKEINTQNHKESLQIIGSNKLDELVHYQNSKGIKFGNTVSDILFHVINHSTYHRGQIASEFKKHQVEPLVTDYIFYKRNQA